MSITLEKQRVISGVVCDTADDVLKALLAIRQNGQEEFLKSLDDAVNTADIDMICGHIDWARAKFGDGCMGASQRSEVKSFYQTFITERPNSSESRTHEFMSEAFDLFV
jgi:hypothetical protein